jgi:hypothetical protein
MIDATRRRGVVGGHSAGTTELVVEADAGSEGEQPSRDPGEEVARRTCMWRSSESSSLQVRKTDPMRWRMGAR